MKITVIGSSGLIGSHLTRQLRVRGHDVVAAAPGTGVDTVAGTGLSDAVAGADVVVDVTDAPSFGDAAVMDFFQTSGRNLLAAELAARVRHHVALSVVGADHMPASGYMRAKAAQEQLVGYGLVPYTIVRCTQFFEFLNSIACVSSRDSGTIRLSPVLMQPIAAQDTATILADIAEGEPRGGHLDIAGPERLRQDELVRRLLVAQHDPRAVVADPTTYYFGAAVDDTTLVPPRPWQLGSTHFTDWLTGRGPAIRARRR
ncbi:SDR family oxidoreductase [Catellatospora paridis]|uniref:SDR family oxidoreductase n=1 Tax=Catellatospora paridis TaxID=1617086 RepID=UPI0012D4B112|nr:SDR family oxidoreductase [Catellatospora paridis]